MTRLISAVFKAQLMSTQLSYIADPTRGAASAQGDPEQKLKSNISPKFGWTEPWIRGVARRRAEEIGEAV